MLERAPHAESLVKPKIEWPSLVAAVNGSGRRIVFLMYPRQLLMDTCAVDNHCGVAWGAMVLPLMMNAEEVEEVEEQPQLVVSVEYHHVSLQLLWFLSVRCRFSCYEEEEEPLQLVWTLVHPFSSQEVEVV